MNKIRFRYTKTGKAKFISHLDLMATMQRALLRSGVELKYSEGFNPHPYMSVALPLPVGCSSECELLDVGLADDRIPDIGKITLPEGITITEAYKPSRKFNDIAWVDICWRLYFNDRDDTEIKSRLEQCFSADSIIVSKRTKRLIKDLDIAPFIKDFKVCCDKDVLVNAKISAQNPTISPTDLESAVEKEIKPDFTEIKRIDIYNSNMVIFK